MKAEAKAENTEAALKAALLRSEAAETALRREREMQDTVAAMARIGGWELDLATMTPIWSDAVYRIVVRREQGAEPAVEVDGVRTAGSTIQLRRGGELEISVIIPK